ncbi:hypothetical protein EGR_08206 [Echinococcus granulosus]|uniref:Uncharacterized protein n=1 Tax=Echinococcus granulosus TaxID=6210 RepID=W6UUB7_ECHGR|nr:hypothetical protein EGR_08206 [Echinococcus granulosus]EUB56969.1 hypothetical protein EGR_08206 [Echinococcus granulosus]
MSSTHTIGGCAAFSHHHAPITTLPPRLYTLAGCGEGLSAPEENRGKLFHAACREHFDENHEQDFLDLWNHGFSTFSPDHDDHQRDRKKRVVEGCFSAALLVRFKVALFDWLPRAGIGFIRFLRHREFGQLCPFRDKINSRYGGEVASWHSLDTEHLRILVDNVSTSHIHEPERNGRLAAEYRAIRIEVELREIRWTCGVVNTAKAMIALHPVRLVVLGGFSNIFLTSIIAYILLLDIPWWNVIMVQGGAR